MLREGIGPDGFALVEQRHRIVQITFSNDTVELSTDSPVILSVDGSNDAGASSVTAFNCTFAFTGPSQTQTCGGTPMKQGNIVYSQIP